MQNTLSKSFLWLPTLLLLSQLVVPDAVLAQTNEVENSGTTALRIQVRSLDAKFIGSGVGDLNVQVTDVATGRVLDHGRITGPTGDTDSMMTEGQTRGHTPSAPDSAAWTAQLDIDRPTRVRIAVTGPLDVSNSIQQQDTTLWMLPGVDRVDPPLVLHLPGLIVDVIELDSDPADGIDLTASVTMLCGCPITAGGLWRADDFVVIASLYQDGEKLTEANLSFTGTTNQFAGRLDQPESGKFTLYVSAHQRSTANTGVQQQALIMPEPAT